ncbi:conserved hypothetical protein [Trichinella spiralis]|uniref:hypothetical protein n=1 Tax=Trichinella spiralis TaxID=6334 RepID=UPI0001EFDA02|nr:conserved hypothetical protein [Trichinella spiralis]
MLASSNGLYGILSKAYISISKCQLTVIAAWRLPCELHDADRSSMTHLAFRRDIAAHLLRARPLQILRPRCNDICQAVCEAHVDISCSQKSLFSVTNGFTR